MMKRTRLAVAAQVCLSLLVVVALAFPMGSTRAQSEAPAVLILPINNAQFLPGIRFDFRVEVHADALPADFKVTINGEDPSKLFAVEAKSENWAFGPKDKPTPSQSVIWRGVTAPAPGDYKVEVVAGGKTHSAAWTVRKPMAGTARNVILFIGDGMSVPAVTAARVLSRGLSQGKFNDAFAFDKFEEIGLAHTSSIDSLLADSANTASALNTGHKGSVNATGTYSDTSPDLLDDPRVETFAQIIKRLRGMAVGVVTTSDISDATPAAVWAHGRNRSDLARNSYITALLDEKLGVDVLLGGGGRRFIPKATEGSRRGDERNVFDEFEKAGYAVVTTGTELRDAMKNAPKQMLGIFHPSDMNVWLDRNVFKDNLKDLTDQPGLVEMTTSALEILKTNPNGFYLQVEAASIDKQLHPLDTDRALADLIELERAVAAAVEWASKNAPDTLIVVTSDHGHGFDVYGTVDVAKFNEATDDAGKRAAIRVYAAAKYPTYEDKDNDKFPDNWLPSVVLAAAVNNYPDYTEDFQVSPVPRSPASCKTEGEGTAARTVCVDNPDDDPKGLVKNGNLPVSDPTGVHTLQDVPVYATGPGAAYFGKVFDQTEIFFGMAAAIGLDPSATDGKTIAGLDSAKPVASGVQIPADTSGLLLLALGIAVGFVARGRRPVTR